MKTMAEIRRMAEERGVCFATGCGNIIIGTTVRADFTNDEHLAMLEAALGVLPVVKKGKVRK